MALSSPARRRAPSQQTPTQKAPHVTCPRISPRSLCHPRVYRHGVSGALGGLEGPSLGLGARFPNRGGRGPGVPVRSRDRAQHGSDITRGRRRRGRPGAGPRAGAGAEKPPARAHGRARPARAAGRAAGPERQARGWRARAAQGDPGAAPGNPAGF